MTSRPTVAVYYFPNYHADAANERIHGAGWTEWDLVRRAEPRWRGHVQPNVPLWGETDESDPAEMARKIDAAADHGIDVFLFDWYHHDSGKFLHRGLEAGFLQAPNRDRLRFALMWANHDWIDIHPAKRGVPPHCHFQGRIRPDTWDSLTDHVIADLFAQPNYWKPGGKPYFSIYELHTFLESFGGPEGAVEALDRFRAKAVAAGFAGIHLNAVVWAIPVLPGEQGVPDPKAIVDRLGVDSVTSYVWIHHVPLDFPAMPYARCRSAYEAYRDEAADRYAPVPYHPNVTMGWDASPRTVQADRYEPVGYPFMGTLGENTPDAFHAALESARVWCVERGGDEPVVTINAWNEWTEGSYLEPDTVHGTAYLAAVRDVFGMGGTR
ncbi:MAG: glycoside hydrolase family 99-like domain-containing protein [Armatimonadota bacterium]